MGRIYKTFSDVLEKANQDMDKYNPYHDNLGRFTCTNGAKVTVPYKKPTKSGISSRTGSNTSQTASTTITSMGVRGRKTDSSPKVQITGNNSKYISSLRERGVDINETKGSNGETTGWDIGINGKVVHIENLKPGDSWYNHKLSKEAIQSALGRIMDDIDWKRDEYLDKIYDKYGESKKLRNEMTKYDDRENKKRGFSISDADNVYQDVKRGNFENVTETFNENGVQTGWDVTVKNKTLHVDMPTEDDWSTREYYEDIIASGLSSKAEEIDYENLVYSEKLYDKLGDTEAYRTKVENHELSGDKKRGYSSDDLSEIRSKILRKY